MWRSAAALAAVQGVLAAAVCTRQHNLTVERELEVRARFLLVRRSQSMSYPTNRNHPGSSGNEWLVGCDLWPDLRAGFVCWQFFLNKATLHGGPMECDKEVEIIHACAR